MTDGPKWLIDGAPRHAPAVARAPPIISPAPTRYFTLRSTTGAAVTAFQYPVAPGRGPAVSHAAVPAHRLIIVSDADLTPADHGALTDYVGSLGATEAWLALPGHADSKAPQPAQPGGNERESRLASALSAEFAARHRLEALLPRAAGLARGPTNIGERDENLQARARWFSRRTQEPE
jgi:hypothetical protein